MSPGAGLRPSPPPLLRTQPPLPPRVKHPGGRGRTTGRGFSVRKPSRCADGRRLDKVKEEATAAGGRRGTFVQTPATRAVARTLAMTATADAGWVERWRERRLRANVPRRRPVAVTSSFTSHTAPSPSACPASRRPLRWLFHLPQAEPLRRWQAFGQSKGGGDRRRRATGGSCAVASPPRPRHICPDACHPRTGPTARGNA